MTHAAPPHPLPRKANLGCGFDLREGFLNVDFQEFHHPDLVADVTDLSDLPSGHFEHIVAQDVLEHLERDLVPRALAEWSRLLASDGVLELRVPSLCHLLELLCRPDHRSADAAASILHLVYGTQAYSGDYHQSGFTIELLTSHLADVGLMVCRAAIRDEWLFEISARKTHALERDDDFIHYSYVTILGRPVDPAGLQYALHLLNTASVSRDGFVALLESSDEKRFINRYPRYLLPYRERLTDSVRATRLVNRVVPIARALRRVLVP